MLTRIAILFGLVVLVGLILVACGNRSVPLTDAPQTALRLASHNVHYIILGRTDGAWSEGDWDRRKGALDQAFKALDADIVAFQEMESFGRGQDRNINLARDWLLENNPGYRAAASGDANVFPSTQPILYRADRMTLMDQGWFFFSDTPDVIYSRTYNGSWSAFTSWALFDVGGDPLRVVNLHTDYASRENRRLSLELVAERVAPWIATGERIVITGDFNALRSSPLLTPLKDLGVTFVDVPGTTYHFDRGLGIFGAIDHVGLSGPVQQLGETQVLREKYDGVWPSDHYPIVVDLTLTGG